MDAHAGNVPSSPVQGFYWLIPGSVLAWLWTNLWNTLRLFLSVSPQPHPHHAFVSITIPISKFQGRNHPSALPNATQVLTLQWQELGGWKMFPRWEHSAELPRENMETTFPCLLNPTQIPPPPSDRTPCKGILGLPCPHFREHI